MIKRITVNAPATITSGALSGISGIVSAYDSLENKVVIRIDEFTRVVTMSEFVMQVPAFMISYQECECIKMPAGLDGLEGFHLNQRLRYNQDMDTFRIWQPEWEKNSYYESCDRKTFKKYFKPIL
jgi:hypothetical protein